MLVLSRKRNQRIVIANNIELVVVAVSGDRVKLGFSAPANVPIYREEVQRRIDTECPAISHKEVPTPCVT
jgi:carbon storage regulator